MGDVHHLRDADDPRLADYVALNDGLRRRQLELATSPGFFIAEGLTVLARLLASPYRPRSVVTIPTRLPRVLRIVGEHPVPVLVVERDVLARVVGFDLHRGVVAAADRLPARDPREVVAQARTLAVLEGINDHENLGAIARSAVALGADGFLLDPTCADPLYRRSVRVSMGAWLLVPFARLEPWPGSLTTLAREGWRVLALTPAASATPLRELHRRDDNRVAVLLGAEGPGLSTGAMAAATDLVRIPIRPEIDSLNVGHAAAIAFEALQRVGRRSG